MIRVYNILASGNRASGPRAGREIRKVGCGSMNKRGELELLNGPIWDKLVFFALPLALTGILQQLFNAADVAVVGKFAGNAAQAAVGSNGPVIGLLVNLFVGLSLGTNVIVSQLLGSGDHEGVRRTVHTSIVVSVIGGIFLAILGQFIARPVVELLDVPEEVADMAALYLRIYLMGMPVILLYNFESAIFRSQGDTKTPLIILILSGVVNIALNLLFVVGLHRTVDGVAIATVVSNLLSAGILLWILCVSKSEVRVELRELRLDVPTLRWIMRVGIPAGIQGMVFSLANICVQSAINYLGTVVMAASSAAGYLETFTYSILNAFGQACTTFVGQNYGAGNIQRCRRALRVTFFTGYTCLLVVGGLVLVFATPLLRVFNSDPEVISTGLIRVRYMFLAHIFSLMVEVLSGYLRGYGISLAPALCALVCICGIRFFWVYVLFPLRPTFRMLMLVYPASLSITAAIIAVTTAVKMHSLTRSPAET